jgi:hypothetical protein
MTADYGSGWAEEHADRMQAARMAYLYPENRYAAQPYPDALGSDPRMRWLAENRKDPQDLEDDRQRRVEDSVAARRRSRQLERSRQAGQALDAEIAARQADEDWTDAYLAEHDVLDAGAGPDGASLSGRAALRSMLLSPRHGDGTVVDEDLAARRKTEFRAEWKDSGTGSTQFRTGPW